jgi:hypothetical protein
MPRRIRMNSFKAIVIAVGLIAGAILLSSRADSQSPALGKFIGVGVSETGAVAWRLDSSTGEASGRCSSWCTRR